ncbi:RNA-binding protein 12B-B [Bombina bombina]|uniref:RNA-binding protein 12B-B n=1 Tax=Bombina bombina TaxID=8345 RepID=UPI00235A984D|nr:RNA-binding protein 12B-B [Bombina bombina]
MALVIRLQGLPDIANSADIRHFFTGLNIPEGGVRIIGGKLGEAFIKFAEDEDGRRAINRTGGVIKNSNVQLFLSSKAEMQHTIEMSFKEEKNCKPESRSSASAEVSKRPFFAHKEISERFGDTKAAFASGATSANTPSSIDNFQRNKGSQSFSNVETPYLFLFGLPYKVTYDEVKSFFHGLLVDDIIFLKRPNGLRNGNGFVKFGSGKDANAGLLRNNEYIHERFISIRKSSEDEWVKAGGQIEKVSQNKQRARSRSPLKAGGQIEKVSQNKQRARSGSPFRQEFFIHLKNLSFGVEKEDIKKFVCDRDMSDSQVKFLLDKNGHRTRECFLVVQNERQFQKCLDLNKQNLCSRTVFISPIDKKSMVELIESNIKPTLPKMRSHEDNVSKLITPESRFSLRRCIYLRNFNFDVSKNDIQKFFDGFSVKVEDIILLYDQRGLGLGEALVTFPSEIQAITAERLHRQCFLGTEILLQRISEAEKKEICFNTFTDVVDKKARRSPSYENKNLGSGKSHEPPKNLFERSDLKSTSGDLAGWTVGLSDQVKHFGGTEKQRVDIRNMTVIDYSHGGSTSHQSVNCRPSEFTTVQVTNLPFTANAEEILNFFHGYSVISNSITVRHKNTGIRTGYAIICFENYEEALAAVNELNDRPIGKRKVSLSIVSGEVREPYINGKSQTVPY